MVATPAAPQVRVFPLFAVPLAQAVMPDCAPLCQALARLFVEREGEDTRNRINRDTQVGLFESRFDLHTWPDPPVRQLFGWIHLQLGGLLQQLCQFPPERLQRLRFSYHSWYHLTRHGGHQGVHNHPMASWSGIFCVDPGDPAPDKPSSGVVRFLDPRAGADMFSDAATRGMQGQFRLGGYQYQHQAGHLVMFPSYVLHEVFAYFGERPRIVVAFNAWVDEPRR